MLLTGKTFQVSALLVVIICVSVAFSAPPDHKYKNLKILPKNISEKELDSVMHLFTRGLNVKCNFCHASQKEDAQKLDFASDEKPEKGIARKMMRLTSKINRKWFDYEKDDNGKTMQVVGCYTCHHGDPHPMRNAPPRQQNNNK